MHRVKGGIYSGITPAGSNNITVEGEVISSLGMHSQYVIDHVTIIVATR